MLAQRDPASVPMDRRPATMRAATYADRVRDALLSVYSGAAEQPVGRVLDALGFTDFRGMTEPQPALSLGQMPDGPRAGAVAKLLAAKPRVANPIKGYHGSPHDFGRVGGQGAADGGFDMSKIGTGEGAQAYGHGLYFAEAEPTARAYRDALAPPEVRVGGKAHPPLNTESPVDMAIADLANGKPMSAAVVDRGFAPRFAQEYKQAVEKYRGQVERVTPGRMYEVNIHADPQSFLDWDAPLSQQQAGAAASSLGDVRPVRLSNGYYGVTRVGPDGSGNVIQGINESSADGALAAWQRTFQGVKGQDAITMLSGITGDKSAAAAGLKSRGIPGIKYLDQGSRAAGEGSRNYVVFDDSLVEILRKYGLLPFAAGLGASGQDQPR